jgi:ACS family hexuronate transporter-like MFS transporter
MPQGASSSSRAESPTGPPNVGAWRWWLTIVLFLATVMTYLNRQTMSLCGAMICDEFHFTNEQYGQLVAAFRWAYAITHVPAGLMADHLPMRMTYSLAVGLWSAGGAAIAWVFGFWPIFTTRAVLGVGEAFNWPCATRIVANTFPPNDRGLASGIFNSGAAVGSLASAVVITPMAVHYGWRTAFVAIGLTGVFWIAVWLFATRRRSKGCAALNAGREFSRTYRVALAILFLLVGVGVPVVAIEYSGWLLDPARQLVTGLFEKLPGLETWLWRAALLLLAAVVGWSLVARHRKSVAFWMLVVVAVTVNPCWYFLNEWIPMYMHNQRNLGYFSAGMVTVPIFLGADLGNLLSGGIIKFLTTCGWSLRAARGTTLAICAALVGPIALITLTDSIVIAILLLGLAGLGITSIVANYTACQQDFSFANVGLVAGFLGMSSNVCSAYVNPYIGRYIDETGHYTLIFVLMAVLPAVSVLAIIVFDVIVHRSKKTTV